MWTVAWYAPVSLFSLKPPFATSAGAKSLLVPTPYALKMALLDAYIRIEGLDGAQDAFRYLRGAAVAVAAPEHACVSNLFTKQLRPTRDGGSERFFQQTIAFREYVYHEGLLGVALSGPDELAELAGKLLPQLDYLGKRGAFLQWRPPLERSEGLDERFVVLVEAPSAFPVTSTMQLVDDCDEDLEFDDVSVYSENRTRRRRVHIPVPYRRVSATRSHTYYRWSQAPHDNPADL